MGFVQLNDAVLVSDADVTVIGGSELERLKRMARESANGRARICAHHGPDDPLHEMLLAVTGGRYIRPHAHRGKSESFHIVEGGLTIVLFDADGQIHRLVDLSDEKGACRYYRLAVPLYHTVVPWDEIAVFHETTNGPFRPEDTDFPDWAPSDTDEDAAGQFLENLLTRIVDHRRSVDP